MSDPYFFVLGLGIEVAIENAKGKENVKGRGNANGKERENAKGNGSARGKEKGNVKEKGTGIEIVTEKGIAKKKVKAPRIL